jgi:hypothetical protein
MDYWLAGNLMMIGTLGLAFATGCCFLSEPMKERFSERTKRLATWSMLIFCVLFMVEFLVFALYALGKLLEKFA